ncbi:GH3 auxin-responsive promoter [Boletus edulis BED1]|uniref:GH3 auxin-responsive promoter n=2 Tax=Boletus edulis BED1 TaxID=1328754 RepID=A0AAD4GAZ4_BOLED|nr:GH3 auxin-responsive promoter [Boletus edulis BED1]
MPLPDLLLSCPSPLFEQLRWRTDELRSKIVRANYNTQFTQTAPELTDFRHATAGLVDGMDDAVLSGSFRKTVPITDYDTYAPLLARFFEKPCEASAIANLFAPGLPDFLVDSSSTSGGVPKSFPYYNRLSKIRSSNARSWVASDPLLRRTTACLCYLGFGRMDVEDEDNYPIKTIYLTSGSVVGFRVHLNLDPEKDEEKMATFIRDQAAPCAAGFIRKWRTFLLIHALFAVSSRSLETITAVFINAFVDMIRYLDAEFDAVVDCIANGTIPDLGGMADVRPHLEVNIVADPERAAELRRIGRPSSRPGWCGRVWPNLRSVHAIASGSFASSVPLARWFLSPDTEIRTHGYGSTECFIGSPYNPLELNQFKLSNNDVIELLDINQNDSTVTALTQLWEAKLGRSYELVLTTQDGLWRYRLGDVVEICGFDPTDGIPVIQFVERRNIAIRFPNFMVAEKELRAAMSSVALSIPINLVNWTAAIDDRCIPVTIGFFVELAGDQVSDLALAPTCLLDGLLQSNEEIASALARDLFRKPTIRVVRESTFSDFLQLKLDEGSNNTGQIKVPVILPKPAYVMWFANQVVQEV